MYRIITSKKQARQNIGRKCHKKSGKPFKSGLKVNTIKGVDTMVVPSRDKKTMVTKICYTFVEDDSLVCVDICEFEKKKKK